MLLRTWNKTQNTLNAESIAMECYSASMQHCDVKQKILKYGNERKGRDGWLTPRFVNRKQMTLFKMNNTRWCNLQDQKQRSYLSMLSIFSFSHNVLYIRVFNVENNTKRHRVLSGFIQRLIEGLTCPSLLGVKDYHISYYFIQSQITKKNSISHTFYKN